jgi:hypothetical protein
VRVGAVYGAGVPVAVRALLLVPAALAGAVAGLLGSFVHAVEPAGLPLGLLLAAALSAAVFVTCGLALGRPGAVAAAGGWLLVVLLLASQRPEGDLVVPGSTEGYLWLLGGMLVAGACTVPRYQRPPPRPPDQPSGDTDVGR